MSLLLLFWIGGASFRLAGKDTLLHGDCSGGAQRNKFPSVYSEGYVVFLFRFVVLFIFFRIISLRP